MQCYATIHLDTEDLPKNPKNIFFKQCFYLFGGFLDPIFSWFSIPDFLLSFFPDQSSFPFIFDRVSKGVVTVKYWRFFPLFFFFAFSCNREREKKTFPPKAKTVSRHVFAFCEMYELHSWENGPLWTKGQARPGTKRPWRPLNSILALKAVKAI